MFYITEYNSYHTVETMVEDVKFNHGMLFNKSISCFSQGEMKKLLAIKCFYSEPESFLDLLRHKSVIKPNYNQDSYNYVYENLNPAYHHFPDCERLHSSFDNFIIPNEIKQRGVEAIAEFRAFFKRNEYSLKSGNVEAFLAKLNARFHLKSQLQSVLYKNSGVTSILKDLDLDSLEMKIEKHLQKMEDYFNSADLEKQSIIRKFERCTGVAYYRTPIVNNDTGYSDRALKTFLKKYNEAFKVDLKCMLKHYFRAKYNPELKFDLDVLEQLGFIECSKCKRRKAGV